MRHISLLISSPSSTGGDALLPLGPVGASSNACPDLRSVLLTASTGVRLHAAALPDPLRERLDLPTPVPERLRRLLLFLRKCGNPRVRAARTCETSLPWYSGSYRCSGRSSIGVGLRVVCWQRLCAHPDRRDITPADSGCPRYHFVKAFTRHPVSRRGRSAERLPSPSLPVAQPANVDGPVGTFRSVGNVVQPSTPPTPPAASAESS